MLLPPDYAERVYAGVLGKIIGVYLGRPFEGWTYERILDELGEITGYVNDRMPGRPPIVVTDDDISGSFTFLRALPDYGNTRAVTAEQIGQTWLNYIIEGKTTLWWGGFGNSTEHTAYLRLKHGVSAPDSGSIALNGRIVAEQIGAQIFIDGWGMVAPGDPDLAADLARRAASVSHDGEAIYGAQVVAAMEALAFVERDINTLIDGGLAVIPKESTIYRLIEDIRRWHAADRDWHACRARIGASYNYEIYGGNCHMVPNHALIILGLLYGDGNFDESMEIVNTAGWDTDCNSGNLGCLLGIRNGLEAFSGSRDWRGPLADRLYLPTADGGRAITDAVTEAIHVVNTGRALAGATPMGPKGGARYHFSFPGSVQGWRAHSDEGLAPVTLANVAGHSQPGERSLQITVAPESGGRIARVGVYTFIPPDAIDMAGYTLLASPTLYPGQRVRAGLAADDHNKNPLAVQMFLRYYGAQDVLNFQPGPKIMLAAAETGELHWQIPDMGGAPIAEIGLELWPAGRAEQSIYLDYLGWEGAPDVHLTRPETSGRPWESSEMWRRAWVSGVDQWEARWKEPYRLVQNEGRGLIIQGTREWMDYEVSANLTITMASMAGVAVRVQGLRRYYGLVLVRGGLVKLIKALDGESILAEARFEWHLNQPYALRLRVEGERLRGHVDGKLLLEATDRDRPLMGGAAAYIVEEGTLMSQAMRVRPVGRQENAEIHAR